MKTTVVKIISPIHGLGFIEFGKDVTGRDQAAKLLLTSADPVSVKYGNMVTNL